MKNKNFITSIVISFILAVLPFIIIFFLSNGKYPVVPVEIVDDSAYYYSRAVESAQGNPFIGNPYIRENNQELSLSFFVADWLWSLPLFLGFPIQGSIIVSQVLWFLIFGMFLYYLFLLFDLEKKYVPLAILFVFLSVYWYLARPVAMQVVFPVFVIWLSSFVLFIKNPKSKKSTIFLILTTALSIYVYTYLAQVVFVVLLLILIAAFSSHFKKFRTIWYVGIGSFLLSIPFLVYTWKQINHPLYLETLSRIGLVNTRMIGISAIFYVSIVVLGLIIIFMSKERYSDTELFFIVPVSLGLVGATISNVITGRDLELAVHLGRFIELWSVILLCVMTKKLFTGTEEINFKKLFSQLIYLFFIIYFIIFQIRVWSILDKNLLSKEAYSNPLNWINENLPKNSIVFANDSFSGYIPIMTENYVLFHPNALLQIDSDKNIQNRYLVSRLFNNLELENIKNDMRKYAGAGHTAHRHMVHNRNVKFCKMLRLELTGKDCGQFETQYSIVGEKYFIDMENQYNLFRKNPADTLKEYGVNYVVYDKQNDKWSIPKFLELIWTDGRFEIFMVR